MTSQVQITRTGFRRNPANAHWVQAVTIKNTGSSAIAGPVSYVLDGLANEVSPFTQAGNTACLAPLNPYRNAGTGLTSGQSTSMTVELVNPSN